jgi:hypothetical protein
VRARRKKGSYLFRVSSDRLDAAHKCDARVRMKLPFYCLMPDNIGSLLRGHLSGLGVLRPSGSANAQSLFLEQECPLDRMVPMSAPTSLNDWNARQHKHKVV